METEPHKITKAEHEIMRELYRLISAIRAGKAHHLRMYCEGPRETLTIQGGEITSTAMEGERTVHIQFTDFSF